MSYGTMMATEADATTLSLTCLAHMEQEEAMLSATLDSLQRVRAALLGRDLAALERAVELQAHTERAAQELLVRRAELRVQLGTRLKLNPQTITLKEVAMRLPGEQGLKIARCRDRLHRMAAEIGRLNRGNAALVQHSMDFLHKFLVSVTGGDAVGDRYGSSGGIERATCGSLFEGRA